MKALRRPLLVIAAAFFLAASAAQAGAPTFSPVPAPRPTGCSTRDYIISTLKEKYGETRRGAGLSGPIGKTVIFEIWASEATGTWTILKTTPDGRACLMEVGDGWHDDTGNVTPIGDPA